MSPGEGPAIATDRLERYRGKTVLVTGGTGFIGSAVVGALNAADARILVVRGRHDGSVAPADGAARIEMLDADGRSIFGAIDQRVCKWSPADASCSASASAADSGGLSR